MLLVTGDAIINDDWYIGFNKALEVFCGVWDSMDEAHCNFKIELRWDKPSDHQGFGFMLCLGKFELDVKISDTRHWDPHNKRWIETEQDNIDFKKAYDSDESFVKSFDYNDKCLERRGIKVEEPI